MAKRKLAVVAIGGNSLIKDENHKSVEDQYQAAKETTYHIADMIEQGWDVAIGHGNGPQVGFILRRSEIAAKREGMHEVPLDVCGADSQGAIGYALQQNLQNELYRRRIKSPWHGGDQVLVDKKTRIQNPANRSVRSWTRAKRKDGERKCSGRGGGCERGWRRWWLPPPEVVGWPH
jgi:carbamate kinase